MKHSLNPLKVVVMAAVILLVPVSVLAQTTHIITVGDNFFSPTQLTIQAGDTVRWVNAAGGNSHNVTSNTGAWTPPTTAPSFEFEVTFDNGGAFAYRCTVHPSIMFGTINVQGGAAAAELSLESIALQNGPIEPFKLINVASDIRNNGDAASGQYSVNFYLSGDTAIESSDTLLGTGMGTSLDASESAMTVTNLQLPDIAPGEYSIGAIITFNDANQGNNVNSDPTRYTYARFTINPGLNDAWFNANTAGQGFFIIIFEDINLVFLSWFTYDTERPDASIEAILGEAGHRWLTAQGPFAGDTATLDIVLTTGGVFDSGDPAVENDAGYGTITIVWHDCENATLTYNIPSLGLMGSIELTRITLDNVPMCEEMNDMMQ